MRDPLSNCGERVWMTVDALLEPAAEGVVIVDHDGEMRRIDAHLSLFGPFSTAVPSIIGSVAWPAVLVMIALVFTGQIASARGPRRRLDLRE
jgi:hypothetical protein